MKKGIIAAIVSFILVFGMVGCGKKYTPEEGAQYYKIGEVYRIIEIETDKAESFKKYGLNSIMMLMGGAIETVDVSAQDTFKKNSLFFREPKKVNNDGIAKIYELLEIEAVEISDNYYGGKYSPLYTYNTKQLLSTEFKATIKLDDKPRFTVFGDVADVTVYNINYEDRAVKDGKKTGSGSFEVYVAEEVSFDYFMKGA